MIITSLAALLTSDTVQSFVFEFAICDISLFRLVHFISLKFLRSYSSFFLSQKTPAHNHYHHLVTSNSSYVTYSCQYFLVSITAHIVCHHSSSSCFVIGDPIHSCGFTAPPLVVYLRSFDFSFYFIHSLTIWYSDYYVAMLHAVILNGIACVHQFSCLMPVSYTHLDVYKRQEAI